MRSRIGLFVFLLFLIAVSCKKKEVTIPEITYYSPFKNQGFEYNDTIQVHCIIADQNSIESVKLVLVNSDLIPIGQAFYFYPSAPEFELKTYYPLSVAEIAESNNYLLVVAKNNSSFKNAYQPLVINTLEREFENTVILTWLANNEISVDALYPFGDSIVDLFDLDGDYADSDLNSANHQLFIAGKQLMNLQTYNLINNQLEWGLPLDPFFPIHNAECLHFDEKLFVANNYFNIKGYTITGSSIFTANIEQNERPGAIFRYGEFLLCDMQSKNGGVTNLVTWYVNSEVEKQRLQTVFEIVDYVSITENELLLAVNSGEIGFLNLYDPEFNVLTELIEFPERINAIVKTTYGQVLVGVGQNIYLYSLPGNYPEVVLPGIVAYRLKFENLSQQLYVVGSYAIDVFSFPQLDHLQQITFNDSLLNIHFQYNK